MSGWNMKERLVLVPLPRFGVSCGSFPSTARQDLLPLLAVRPEIWTLSTVTSAKSTSASLARVETTRTSLQRNGPYWILEPNGAPQRAPHMDKVVEAGAPYLF